jgi:hypothetical protein
MHRCSTQVKSVEEFRNNLVTRAIQNVDNGQVMNLKMNFYVLYSSSEMNVSEDIIKENLKVLTETFMGTHPDYEKIPEEGRYACRSVVGIPNIRFMYGGIVKRIDITKDLTLKNISTSEFPVTLIESYMAKNNISDPGSLYVFTGDTGDILGQTHPSKPLCVINYKAIGGYSMHGISTTYGLGKTLCHETGHMFDLPHTFTGTCDQLFDDIPAQKYENYEFFLTKNNQGKWDGAMCNRYRDYWIAQTPQNSATYERLDGRERPYSCIDPATFGADEKFEQGTNIMDYNADSSIIHFSAEQSKAVRTYVLANIDNGLLKLYSDDDYEASLKLSEKITNSQNAYVGGDGTINQNITNGADGDTTGLSDGAIAGIVIMVLVIVFGVSGLIYWKRAVIRKWISEKFGSDSKKDMLVEGEK